MTIRFGSALFGSQDEELRRLFRGRIALATAASFFLEIGMFFQKRSPGFWPGPFLVLDRPLLTAMLRDSWQSHKPVGF